MKSYLREKKCCENCYHADIGRSVFCEINGKVPAGHVCEKYGAPKLEEASPWELVRTEDDMKANYTDEEICTLYRGARNKRAQIRILSELTLRPQVQIRAILKRAGYDVAGKQVRKRPQRDGYRAKYDELAQRLYDAGKTPAEMAEIIGIPKKRVQDWHYRKKYTPNRLDGCSNCIHSEQNLNGKYICEFKGRVLAGNICERHERT